MPAYFTVYKVTKTRTIDQARWQGGPEDFATILSIRNGSEFNELITSLFRNKARKNDGCDIVECTLEDFKDDNIIKLLRDNVEIYHTITEGELNYFFKEIKSYSEPDSEYYSCCCYM